MMLALKLGRTLEELGRTMSAQEFSLWLAFYDRDLWGEMGDYHRAGIVAATIANYAGMTRARDAAAATPEDFMPIKREVQPEAEPDPVAYFQAIAAKDR